MRSSKMVRHRHSSWWFSGWFR